MNMTAPYAKHTTSTDALETLGSIIGPNEARDAIHLAVFNAVAGDDMAPGAHVVLDGTDKTTAFHVAPGNGIGIVDPFLLAGVKTGERFWLVVYPRQITSLRHVWEHPAFPDSGEAVPPASNDAARATAEAWLRTFCEHADCPGFHAVVAKAMNNSDSFEPDEYLHFDGQDAHGEIPAEFWEHMEAYTGRRFALRPKYFSCSC